MKGETAKLRAAWTSYSRGGCGARRSRRRRWRTAAAGALVAAESESGVVVPAEWGQDGVSKASEGFGQGYWLVFTGARRRADGMRRPRGARRWASSMQRPRGARLLHRSAPSHRFGYSSGIDLDSVSAV